MKKIIGFWVTLLTLTGFSILGLSSCNVAEPEGTYILRMQLDDSLAVESNLFDSIDIDLFDSSGNMTHADIFHGPYRRADAEKLANLVLTTKIPNPVTIRVTAFKDTNDYWVFTIMVADGSRQTLPPVHTGPSNPVVPNPVDTLSPTRIVITSPATTTLYLGDPSISLSALVEPPTAIQTVTWSLSSGDAAVLEAGNKLKALQAGTVTLIATSTSAPSISASLEMTIKNAPTVLPASVLINHPSPLVITVNDPALKLDASVLPADAKQDIKWTLPSNTVAILEQGNLIKGLKAGTITLTASSAVAPTIFDTLVVTVQDPPAVVPEALSLLMATPMVLAVGGDGDLQWAVLPEGADQGVDWTSSDIEIAQIVGGNKVRPLKKGSAKITGKSKAKPTITASFDLSVIVPVQVDAINILPKTLTLYTGGPEGKLNVTLTGNDTGAQYTLASSDPAIATVSAAGSVKGLAAGSAVITASVVGYPSVTSKCSVQVVKDLPVVTVSPNQNVAFNGEALFTVSVAPQAYGTTVEIKADMDGDSVFEQTVLNKETADFKHKYTEVKTTTVSFKVKDTEGNEVTLSRKVTVGAPGAPTVSIVNPSKDTSINVLSFKIRFTVKDTAAKIDTFVDSTVTLIAGSNKVRAVRQNAGGEGSDEVTILVDNTAPTVAIDGAATRTTGAAAFTVTGTASDLSSGLQSVSIAGALSGNGAVTVTAGEWSKGLTLAEGANTLVATALDKAGNTKTVSITVTLDSKKPGIPVVAAPAAVRVGPIKWTWTKANTDGSGKFKVKINGGPELDATLAEYSLATGLVDGTVYGLAVKETDPVAGDGVWSAEKKVLYDTKKPDPVVTANATSTKTPTWNWTSNGGVGIFRWYYKTSPVTYIGNNSTLKTYSPSIANGTEGPYTLCVQEKDNPEWAGGPEEWGTEKCATINVDTKAPTISKISVPNGFITSQKTNALKISYTVDNATTPTEVTCTLLNDKNDKSNTCTLTATDAAGNSATVNLTVWWRSNVVFVNKSATGGAKDGTSWKNAFHELYDALDPGTRWPNGTEFWVAEGNYGHAPSPAYEIEVTPSYISVFGGFNKAGTATVKTDRAPSTTKSVISTSVSISENAGAVIWDGFSHEISVGSGIMFWIFGSSAQVKNSTFSTKNVGVYSAITIRGNNTKIIDCKFGNMAVQMAAIEGIGSAEISGTTISSITDGPALYISQGGSWKVTKSTFQDNFGQETTPYNVGLSDEASLNIDGCTIQGGKASIQLHSEAATLIYGPNNTPNN